MGQLQAFKLKRNQIQNMLLKYILLVILMTNIEILKNFITFLNFRKRNF